MQRSLAQLENIVRNSICPVCAERPAPGPCVLEAAGECALFQFFPRVARALQSARGGDINDSIAAIRRDVCSVCRNQQAGGDCRVRREGECALDAYLVLLVDVIGEAAGRPRSGSAATGLPI
jgi:hypothetical protein